MKVSDLNASYVKDFFASHQTNKKFENKNDLNKLDNQNEQMREHFSKLGKFGAKGISNAYFMEFQSQTFNFANGSFSIQSFTFGMSNNNADFLSSLQNPTNKIKGLLENIDLSKIGYNGKPIHTLNQDEAKALISEDGFFGINQTSQRIADFIINGAGDDINRLKAGKDGMLRGFEEAKKMWGEELPDISKETINKSIEKIDKRIATLGGNAVDIQA